MSRRVAAIRAMVLKLCMVTIWRVGYGGRTTNARKSVWSGISNLSERW